MKPLLLLILFFPLFFFGQKKVHVHFSPKLMRENASVLRFKRPKDFNPVYDVGFGGDVNFFWTKALSPSLVSSYGPSIGQYLFWNRKLKTDNKGVYRERVLYSPVCMNVHLGNMKMLDIIQGKDGTSFNLSVKAGMGYQQNTKAYLDPVSSVNDKKWVFCSAFSLNFWNVKWKRRIFPVFMFGFEYMNIGGRHFGSTLF